MSINDEFTPPTIIDYDYYVSQYILPVVDNVAEQRRLIERWIIQCSDQIDVLCGGRVYEEFPNLDLTKDKDKKRAYYLRKAVCSLLEYYIDTGKAFVDKNFSSASNVPANINASSEDANFEHKRKDIIKLLTQGNWYQTFNTYTNALDYPFCNTGLHYDFDYDDLVDRLSEIFKRLDNHNSFNTNQVLNNYNLTHIKELVGYNVNTSYIRNFKLDSSVDVSKVIKVSTTGTSSAKANFITINGVEWFIGGSGSGVVTDIKQNGTSVLDYYTGIADIDAYKKADAQRKVYYGETAPENPQDNDIWVVGSGEVTHLDYNQLQNNPQINGVELLGNKSLSDLGGYNIYDAAHPDTTTYNAQTIDDKISESAAVFRGTFTGGATRPASFDYDTYCKNQMTAEGVTPTNADYLFILWTDTNEYDRCRYTEATDTWQFEYTFSQFTQVQSDWNQTDTTAVNYIKNKPTIPTEKHLYRHYVYISHNSNNSCSVHIQLLTTNDTQITTIEQIYQLISNNINDGLIASGYINSGGTYYPVLNMRKNTSNQILEIQYFATTWQAIINYIIHRYDTTATVRDTVTQIF